LRFDKVLTDFQVHPVLRHVYHSKLRTHHFSVKLTTCNSQDGHKHSSQNKSQLHMNVQSNR